MKKELYSRIQTKYSFTDNQMVLLSHGIDIVINDSINFLSILVISAAAGDFLQGLIYILVFTSMRRHSGGWHASTKLFCFLSFQIVFIILLLCHTYIKSTLLITLLYIISTAYIMKNAPVQHLYNPLTESEISENRKKLLRNLFVIMIVFIAFSLNNSHYAFTICFASIWNALCMALLKHSKMWRKS